jgi:hypothetical protein
MEKLESYFSGLSAQRGRPKDANLANRLLSEREPAYAAIDEGKMEVKTLKAIGGP